ncbi:alpha/beta fold hydrolase [Bacillus sp. AK031]
MQIGDGEYQLNLNGINHWVKIEGTGKGTIPLIIIHGGPGGNHYTFERTAGPLLSNLRTVVYYEQRGCGRSGLPENDEDYKIEQLTEDFAHLLTRLGAAKVDVLGYSFGGELALEFAYAFPDKINRIVLSGPSLMETNLHKFVQVAGFYSIANETFSAQIHTLQQQQLSIDDLYDSVWSLADTQSVDRLLFESQDAARINRSFWEESRLVNTGLMVKALESQPRKIPLVDRLKEIAQECLIITGVHDRNTGIQVANTLRGKLPQCGLILFEQSAHFPDLEETGRFLEEIERFLNRSLNGSRR